MAVFLLICIGGSAAVIGILRDTEKKEVMKKTVLAGDASAAVGLTVSFLEYPEVYDEEGLKEGYGSYERINDRQWKHTIRFTETGSDTAVALIRDTDTLLSDEEKWERNQNFEKAIRGQISTRGDYGLEAFGSWLDDSVLMEKQFPISLVLDMRNAKEPTQIRIADYVEYYPMINRVSVPRMDKNANIELPEFWFAVYEDNTYYENSTYDVIKLEDLNAKARVLKEYFRIPVIKDEVIEFTGIEDENGEYAYLYHQPVGDSFEPYWINVVTEDAVLFTFNTHTENNAIVDTSLIPGGYGIYRLPYSMGTDGWTDVRTEELNVFYPMNPASDVIDMNMTLDQKTLMVVYVLDKKIRCSLIDTQTGECLYDAEMMPEIETDYWYISSACGEDFFALELFPPTIYTSREDVSLWVLGKDNNGQYGELMHAENNGTLEPSVGNVIFDGERLAQVDYNVEYLTVSVYSEEGLIYQGRYDFPTKYWGCEEGEMEGFTQIRNIRLQWSK